MDETTAVMRKQALERLRQSLIEAQDPNLPEWAFWHVSDMISLIDNAIGADGPDTDILPPPPAQLEPLF